MNYKCQRRTSHVRYRHGPLARYVNLGVAHAPGTFSPPQRISDPDMHHGTCVTHAPWCMSGSLTSGFLRSRWRGKRSRHSRRMHNPQFYVSGKKSMVLFPAHVRSPLSTLVNHNISDYWGRHRKNSPNENGTIKWLSYRSCICDESVFKFWPSVQLSFERFYVWQKCIKYELCLRDVSGGVVCCMCPQRGYLVIMTHCMKQPKLIKVFA